jgi:hypothetical protein
MKILRFISFALIATMLFSALVACKSENIFDQTSNSGSGQGDTLEAFNQGSDSGTRKTEIWETEHPQPIPREPLTIFKDGEYKTNIIRPHSPSPLDAFVYSEIVRLLKDATGVTPEVKTDYNEYTTEPSVLVGSTSYAHTQRVMMKLQECSAISQFMGDMFVMAYSDVNSALRMVERFGNNIKKHSSRDEVTITGDWAIGFSREFENPQSFDSTGLIASAELPKLGGEALAEHLYAGQGSNLYIQKNATLDLFNTFCLDLAIAGFRYYTDNEINDNRFATYVTQSQIVHIMYFKARKEIRIAVDKRGEGKSGFALPRLFDENVYNTIASPSLTMVEIDNTGYGGGMCFIYKLSNGKFFVVDSGVNKTSARGSSAQWIYKTLKELAGSEQIVVAGWLITHVHSDHLGGLYDMSMDSEITQNLIIEQLIHNEPADEVTKELDNLTDSSANKIWAWMNPITEAFNIKSVIKAHPGQILYYADAKVTVLASQDVTLDIKESLKDSNDVSVVTQIEFNGKKILMLGDAIKNENAFLARVYGSALKSDVLQVTHHGLNESGADTAEGNPNSVNQLCAPKITLWPAGYDSCHQDADKYAYALTVKLNSYLVNNTVKYGAKDGNVTFDENWSVKAPFPIP